MFNQNYKNGGFQSGNYSKNADSPTTINWTRQSRYDGPEILVEKWKLELSDTLVHSSPIIGQRGEIYFGSGSGRLYSISDLGRVNWKCELEGILETPVLSSEEIIYIGSRNNALFAVNTEGQIIWKYDTANPVNFPPTLGSDGTIYIVCNDTLHAVTPDGTEKWVFKSNGTFWTSITIGNDGTLFAGANGSLFALDTRKNVKWKISVGASFASAPLLSSLGILYVEWYIEGGKRLFAVNSNDGSILWSVKREKGGITTSPAIDSNNVLYVGSNSFELNAIGVDGTLKWSQKVEGYLYNPPLVSDNEIIYFTSSKVISNRAYSWLYCVNNDGNVNSVISQINGTATAPALSKNGTIYVVSGYTDKNNLTLHAFNNGN